MDVQMKTAMNRQIKEEQKNMVMQSKAQSSNKTNQAAMESKQDKQAARERLEMQRR